MADVFVSYKREDRARTEAFAARLRRLGLDVWFDARLVAGESFDAEIEREVRSAKAVLVLWSKRSVDSRWVRNEASLGLEERKLAAIQIEPCPIPLAFRDIHYETLFDEQFSDSHPAWVKLCQRLEYLTGKSLLSATESPDPDQTKLRFEDSLRPATPLPQEMEFSPQEHWAWGRISRGEIADLSYYPNDMPDGASTDLNTPDDWPAHRTLSEKFLRVVLLLDPWASVSDSPRVVIANALIADPVGWEGRLCRRNFKFLHCVFLERVDLSDFSAQSGMSMRGCHVRKAFFAPRIQSDAPLELSTVVFKDDVNIENARISGDLILARTEFHGELVISHGKVDGSLLIREASAIGRVWIDKCQIRDDVDAASTSFSSDIKLKGAHIGGDLAFYSANCGEDLDASGVQVGGSIMLRGGRMSGGVILDRAHVNGDVRVDEVEAHADWLLIRMHVGGDVLLFASRIDAAMDFSGSEILGELVLGRREREVVWGESAQLVLRNATAGAFVVSPSALRGNGKKNWLRADLRGFSYQRLSSVRGETSDSLLGVSPYIIARWLSAQSETQEFDPQPYLELARNLNRANRERSSIKVLRAMQNHRRRARSTPLLQKFGLAMSEQLIGYGYAPWRALLIFPFLIVTGVMVGSISIDGANFQSNGDASPLRMAEWSLFSIQNAVPGLGGEQSTTIWLREQYEAAHVSPAAQVYFSWFFLLHRIVGFVFVAYLIAAVSGLSTRGLK